MSQLHTDDKFMYAFGMLDELNKQTQSEWENQLIDDFDDYDTVPRDYRNRVCIDDATPADWDALADKRLKSRGVDTSQEPASEEPIDWSIAPIWANYWAMDSDGDAYWYDRVPAIDVPDGAWTPAIDVPQGGWEINESMCILAYDFGHSKDNWQSSLNSREGLSFSKDRRALDEMLENAEDWGMYDDPPKARDKMIGGDHYRQGGIQPIEYIYANNLGFCEANAVKYLTRWRYKDGMKDLEKAKHYIELLMELEGEEDGYNG